MGGSAGRRYSGLGRMACSRKRALSLAAHAAQAAGAAQMRTCHYASSR